MGAVVIAYWPGITEEQIDSQPDFYNDTKPFGNWMANREEEPAAMDAIRKLKAEAILSYKRTVGMMMTLTGLARHNCAMLRRSCVKLCKRGCLRPTSFLKPMN